VKRHRKTRAAIRNNPAWFVKRALGVNLWWKQAEIAQAVADNDLVSVRSANGVGKSFLAACLTPWFLSSHRPGYVVTTSSSWTNIKRTLWPEIHRIKAGAPHIANGIGDMGEILDLEWKWGPQWGAFAVSTKTPENISGFRTPHGVFIIMDEASALEPDIFDAMMGLCSAHGSKILLIGNPLRPEGPFFETFGDPDWKNFHISAMESPNVVSKSNDIPGLATELWLERMTRKWGKGTPQYLARVKGEFPESAEDTVVPKPWLEEAYVDAVGPVVGILKMGVDIARYGTDTTVLCIRDDKAIRHEIVRSKQSLTETAGLVKRTIQEWGIDPANVFIDDIGLGGGVTDTLHEQGIMVVPVNFGAGSQDQDFLNMRAHCYWGLRLALDPDGENPMLMPRKFAELAAECIIPRYKVLSTGKIQLESKDDIKKRIGKSPDRADALALTFADTDTGQITVDTLW